MKHSQERGLIDEQLVAHIEKTLAEYGVPKEKAFECYDKIRFQCEARAVLLNRVPDRNNEAIGYYGGLLKQLGERAGVVYEPGD